MTENQRRKFLKLVGASLAGAAGVSILGCEPENTLKAVEPLIPDAVEDVVSAQTVSRKALAERLKVLAESEPPTDLSPGALCYTGPPPFHQQTPCPDCGEMMKVGEMDEILSAYNVPVKRIRDLGLDATLILPEHCPGCGLGLNACGLDGQQAFELHKSPEDWKRSRFHLEIRYPDDPDFVRVELGTAVDLEFMALFLQGKDRWKDQQDGEYALKYKVNRLRELFGVKE